LRDEPGLKPNLECDDYMDAYQRIFNDFNARDDFVEKLTEEKNPIVFVVPHKLLGSKQGVTAGEMRWLLANPEKMENIHFVFSAYRIFSKKDVVLDELQNPSFQSHNSYFSEKAQQEFFTEAIATRIFSQLKNPAQKLEVNDDLVEKKQKIEGLAAVIKSYENKLYNPKKSLD
jgi:hypothetical protein